MHTSIVNDCDVIAIVAAKGRSSEMRQAPDRRCSVLSDTFVVVSSPTFPVGSTIRAITQYDRRIPVPADVDTTGVVRYLLVGKKRIGRTLPLHNLGDKYTPYLAIPSTAPNEISGLMLLRTDQERLQPGKDTSSRLLRTLAKSYSSSDPEVTREALVATWNMTFSAVSDPIEGGEISQWKDENLRDAVTSATMSPSVYTRTIAYSILGGWSPSTFKSTRNLFYALSQCGMERTLDREAAQIIQNAVFGLDEIPSARVLDTADNVRDDWLRYLLLYRLPEPKDESTYDRLVSFLDHPDKATGVVAATVLSRFANRPDLCPSTDERGRLGKINEAELADLSDKWKSIRFKSLHESLKVVPVRRAG